MVPHMPTERLPVAHWCPPPTAWEEAEPVFRISLIAAVLATAKGLQQRTG